MSDHVIDQGQTLTESWEVVYTRPHLGKPIEARLWWKHPVHYALSGKGNTVEEARLDLVLKVAAAIADDPHAEPAPTPESVRRLVNAGRRGLRAVS